MKSLTLAGGIATFVLAASSASAAVVTLGGPLSRLCYESARLGDVRDSSIEACTRALQEEALGRRDEAATLVNRGILYMSRRSDAQADADFDAAIGLDDRLSDAWLNKGFLRLRQGNGREALPLLQKGIDRGARRQALAIFARGVAYEQMGDFRSAYRDLRRAHDLEPRWSLPSEYLANYRISSARFPSP
jgi:tetratricopeptide (TPR) repeat protein